MKNFFEKFKAFWVKVWEYIKYLWKNPKTTLPAFIIAELLFWIPVWLPAIFALTINPWWWTVVGSVIAFWAGPITPAIALQVGFIAAIERLIVKIKNNKEKNKNDR